MIQSPLQISKDCQDFEDLKPCGSNAFFSIYNEDRCKEMILPLTNIQALDPLNEIFFLFNLWFWRTLNALLYCLPIS